MALRKIITEGDPILNKVSRNVERFDARLAGIIEDLIDTLAEAKGVGLAAVQVGILRRIVVVNTGENYIELVNPEIVEIQGEQEAEEGCLSLPGQSGITLRPAVVKLKAQDRKGKWHVYKREELLARCFCHEIDHLNGILFTKHVIRPVEEDQA